ncbi:MAG: penicillin-binding transpeptidase domain-containing protein, partial [Candidatus Brocadiaceae bacterium]
SFTRASGSHVVDTVRGGIYTRWGTPLAVQLPSFDLGVDYGRLSDEGWQHRVAALTGRSVEELRGRAARIIRRVERIRRAVQRNTGLEHVRVVEQNQPHWVVRDVAPEVAALVRAEPDRFPGVVCLENARRCHPNGTLAPHIVGEVGVLNPEEWREVCREDSHWTMRMPVSQIADRYKMDDRIGRSGMEAAREADLRGRRGHVIKRLNFRILRVEKQSRRLPPEPGREVYLTLRQDFQQAANGALRRAAETPELGFKQGALVILDVHTGAVLAAATYPSFDLATYRDDFPKLAADERRPLLFRPTQAALPTGSVYKVITAIAALEEGAIAPATRFTCRGVQRFANRPFHCASRWGHGTLSLVPAIEHSCNIYFYNAGLGAGGEGLARWGRRFGLGVPSGVDLPFSRSGQVPNARATFQIINLSIGQGRLLCTPVQVANAMAAIANGGRLYTPHFFHRATDAAGAVVERFEPEFAQVPVSEENLRTVREGMRLVVESGTARRAGLDPFRVAGKTGTAELGDTELKHAWFAGFAPFEDPGIAFAVVNERVPGGHGGSHAAPIVAFALEEIWDEVERLP